jgi:hypothetical protein
MKLSPSSQSRLQTCDRPCLPPWAAWTQRQSCSATCCCTRHSQSERHPAPRHALLELRLARPGADRRCRTGWRLRAGPCNLAQWRRRITVPLPYSRWRRQPPRPHPLRASNAPQVPASAPAVHCTLPFWPGSTLNLSRGGSKIACCAHTTHFLRGLSVC